MQKEPFTIVRPWGEFRQFSLNEQSTVKIISVKSGATLSLQYHHKRNEFWHVISGNPDILIGDTTVSAKPGDEFQICTGVHHRISAPKNDVQILEVARGHFDEEDIIRLQDKYGRA